MGEQIEFISVGDILSDNQVRSGEYNEQELVGLALAIREVGQLVPIRVRPTDDGYAIVDGHRRYLAMMRLKRPSIAAIVDKELSEGEALHRQWISNCQRAEILQIDRARAIKRLMEITGWTSTEAAKRLGVSGATVSRAISLLSLPEPIIAEVEEGRLTPSTACELAKVADPVKQAELAAAAAEGEITRDAVSAEIKRTKKWNVTRRRGVASAAVVDLHGGRSVTVSSPKMSLEALSTCLDEALNKARQVLARGGDLVMFLDLCREEAKAGPTAA